METYLIYYHPTGYLLPGFRSDMEQIARCSDGVVFPIYESEIIQKAWPEEMARGFGQARAAGLKVLVTFRLGNLFAHFWPSEFAQSHTDSWVVGSDGARRPFCCVNDPVFRSFSAEHIETFLNEFHVDGVFLDEPANNLCFCPHCKLRYRSQYGQPMEQAAPQEALAFARESLLGYLSMICRIATQHKARTLCCLIPWTVDMKLAGLIAGMSELDVFGIDPYWRWPDNQRDLEWFARAIDSFRPLVRPGMAYMVWIQNFLLPAGVEHEILEAARIAAGKGASILGGMYFWRGTANPAAAWNWTRRAFRDAKRRTAQRRYIQQKRRS